MDCYTAFDCLSTIKLALLDKFNYFLPKDLEDALNFLDIRLHDLENAEDTLLQIDCLLAKFNGEF